MVAAGTLLRDVAGEREQLAVGTLEVPGGETTGEVDVGVPGRRTVPHVRWLWVCLAGAVLAAVGCTDIPEGDVTIGEGVERTDGGDPRPPPGDVGTGASPGDDAAGGDAADGDAAGDDRAGSGDPDADDDAETSDRSEGRSAGEPFADWQWDGEGVAPMPGRPGTSPDEAPGRAAGLDDAGRLRGQAVTTVRLGVHDGFTRVVFELVSDGGVPGWQVAYREPRAQGSGDLVEVAGSAALVVTIRPVLLPPDLPDDVVRWDTPRLDAPAGGVLTEVVNGPVYEGAHQFFVGVDRERPVLVDRLADPPRVVIDVLHESMDEAG